MSKLTYGRMSFSALPQFWVKPYLRFKASARYFSYSLRLDLADQAMAVFYQTEHSLGFVLWVSAGTSSCAEQTEPLP
jgi:hypothetical protein